MKNLLIYAGICFVLILLITLSTWLICYSLHYDREMAVIEETQQHVDALEASANSVKDVDTADELLRDLNRDHKQIDYARQSAKNPFWFISGP